jgi:hypothetical protein
MQIEPQSTVPDGQPHVPALHRSGAWQALEHLPQFASLRFKSTQAPLQSTVVAGQLATQLPAEHTAVAVHACPHAPQFS